MKRTIMLSLTPFGLFKNHFAAKKFAKGGKIKFTKYNYNSHKDHNPDCDILEGYIDDDTFITYGRYIKGAREYEEFMEYYSGENYVVGSKKKSISRKYDKNEIPAKYKDAWEDLRTEYFSQYNEEGKEELAREEIARLIREGNTSGYEPSWEIKYDIHESDAEMGDSDYEHVAKLIEDGVNSGELNISYVNKKGKEKESRGWWTLTINSFAAGGKVGDKYYELARTLIASEYDSFDGAPEMYIESMGWKKSDYRNIEDLKGQLAFTVADIKELAAILENKKIANASDASETNEVSDFLTNNVAEKINKKYKK